MKYKINHRDILKWMALPLWAPVVGAGFVCYLLIWWLPKIIVLTHRNRRLRKKISTDKDWVQENNMEKNTKQKDAVINDWSSA